MEHLPQYYFGNAKFKTVTRDDYMTYVMADGYGTVEMTDYTVFPGIHLMYDDFNMKYCRCEAEQKLNCVEINHCREGRIEVQYDSECCYLGEGDFICASKDRPCTSSTFPFSSYHGISVILDFDKITAKTNSILAAFSIDVSSLKKELYGDGKYYILRKNKTIEHIFSELYTVHDSVKQGYLQVKVLELLLFISVPENTVERNKHECYSAVQVERIQAVKEFVSEHTGRHYTLEYLANKFNMPLTTMKKCFCCIYGTPLASYARTLRMEEAAHLLRTTERTVMDVASSVGYDNASKFAYAFRDVMQCSTAEYRQMEAWT